MLDATAIGVGAIIGAGIFVVTGIATAHTGPAVVVSMIIAAAISLLTALSFAELTAWLPKEGSVYELAPRLLSPFAGFVTGWMWILSNTFGGGSRPVQCRFLAAEQRHVSCVAFGHAGRRRWLTRAAKESSN